MKGALLWVIRLYQGASANRPPRCRYIPTCSHYAVEAIEEHGPRRGSWFTIRRLSRCHPFGSFGFDPVPPSDTDGPSIDGHSIDGHSKEISGNEVLAPK